MYRLREQDNDTASTTYVHSSLINWTII